MDSIRPANQPLQVKTETERIEVPVYVFIDEFKDIVKLSRYAVTKLCQEGVLVCIKSGNRYKINRDASFKRLNEYTSEKEERSINGKEIIPNCFSQKRGRPPDKFRDLEKAQQKTACAGTQTARLSKA